MNYNSKMSFIEFSYNFNMDFIEQWSNNLFNANNKNPRAKCEICSQLAMKIPENNAILLHVNITANFEHVGCIVSVSLLLTFNM